VIVSALLVCAASLAVRERLRREEAKTDGAFQSLAEEVAGYRVAARGRDAVRVATEAARKRMELWRPFLSAMEPSLAGRIVSVVRVASENGLRIHALSLGPDRLRAGGDAPDWTAARRCCRRSGRKACRWNSGETRRARMGAFLYGTTGGAGDDRLIRMSLWAGMAVALAAAVTMTRTRSGRFRSARSGSAASWPNWRSSGPWRRS